MYRSVWAGQSVTQLRIYSNIVWWALLRQATPSQQDKATDSDTYYNVLVI